MQRNTHNRNRRGSILALSAFLMVALLAMLAFAVDIGYLAVARTETQRTADAAAISAAWQLVDVDEVYGDESGFSLWWNTHQAAREYAEMNPVMGHDVNLGWWDVQVGELEDFKDHDEDLSFVDPSAYNAVRVRVRRDSSVNGELPLFFARVLGQESTSVEATATAALMKNINGFTIPPGGPNLGILPIALDEETWNDLLAGDIDDDNWTWNEETGEVEEGDDGIAEISLYPHGTGSPGNRGTVDIGSANNSTNDLRRQIREGISEADLAYHDGSLELDDNGELELGADPGISAGMKSALEGIIGETRVIPLFREVNGNGNNAVYTIVGWAGVRILEVDLTGSNNASTSSGSAMSNLVLRGSSSSSVTTGNGNGNGNGNGGNGNGNGNGNSGGGDDGGGDSGGGDDGGGSSTSGKRIVIQPAIVFLDGALPAPGGEQPSSFIYSRVRIVR